MRIAQEGEEEEENEKVRAEKKEKKTISNSVVGLLVYWVIGIIGNQWGGCASGLSGMGMSEFGNPASNRLVVLVNFARAGHAFRFVKEELRLSGLCATLFFHKSRRNSRRAIRYAGQNWKR